MPQPTDSQVRIYELGPSASGPLLPDSEQKRNAGSLPGPLIVENELWFCRLRWIAIAILVAFGLLGLAPQTGRLLGLYSHAAWPFVTAAVLTLMNVAFIRHARLLARGRPTPRGAMVNLWAQIILDLAVLTVVVHFMGSLETYVPFVYLFHIVLACMFFSLPQSAAVTVLASLLYIGCVAAEETGLISQRGIYASSAVRVGIENNPAAVIFNVGSAVAIWTGAWVLVSRLSAMVRERDRKLAEANRRMIRTQKDKTSHMLRTTHELKAPFAAIHANAQLLTQGHCGEMPPKALVVLERITRRCTRLSDEIKEMLQLSNLKSDIERSQLSPANLDLSATLRECIDQLRELARMREVSIEERLEPAHTMIVPDHATMLFANLLSNAVLYSHAGGQVRVECLSKPGEGPKVTIEDDGIGIPADQLPKVFDEHYRAGEAVSHNRESTGLGLAIVRHVAQANAVRVRVETRHGAGTRFILQFQSGQPASCTETDVKEMFNGPLDDSR
ncbi:MAG: HAMP domain-containing histidine kinase [Planctomycetes bacterium]|nr:HAMP domain-containing histidine kinase [Planctomycetota bacterium]